MSVSGRGRRGGGVRSRIKRLFKRAANKRSSQSETGTSAGGPSGGGGGGAAAPAQSAAPRQSPSKVMNNYIGIGIDAKVREWASESQINELITR